MNCLKKFVWKFNYKIYASLRDFILFTRLWKHTGRQKFHIGYAKKNIKKQEIMNILKLEGFENSICSWIDDGELLGMRKQKGKYQYHVRFFSDGELRGHYEYSPEGAPVGHLLEMVLKPSKKYFEKIFKKVLIK